MPSWKKIIVSGSDAHLNNITASAGIDVAGNLTGSLLSTSSFGSFVGDGSQLTGLTAAAVTTYTNSGNNRLVSSVDSSTVNGEANLTFDGSVLNVVGDVSSSLDSTGSFDALLLTGSIHTSQSLDVDFGHAGGQFHIMQSGGGTNSLAPSLKIGNNGQGNGYEFTLSVGTSGKAEFSADVVATGKFRGTQFDGVNSRGTPGTALFTATGNGGDGGGMYFGGGGAFDVRFSTTEKERLRIDTDSSGGGIQTSGSLNVGGLAHESASADIILSGNLSGSATTSASFGRLDINPAHSDNTNGVAISALNGGFSLANTGLAHSANGGAALFGSTSSGGAGHSSGRWYIRKDTGHSTSTGLILQDNPTSVGITMTPEAAMVFHNNSDSTLGGPEKMRLTVSGALELHSGSYGVTGSLTSTGSFGHVIGTTFVGSGAGLTSIANSALANDGITIAGQDISLGGSITADTIAGQISADAISGNQINGGTIGSTTITTLETTDVTVGGTLTVNGTLTYISSSNLRVQDSFAFLATGSADVNVDAGILAQSGSADLTGSALYHDASDERWSVSKNVASNATAVAPVQFVSTVKVSELEAGLNSNKTYTGSIDYGKGEMVVDADGEIFIYT